MIGGASTMVVQVSSQGKSATGLMGYLYGEGRRNEHENQHAVFATHSMDAAYPGALAPDEARELGRVLEASWAQAMRTELSSVGAPGRGVDHNGLVDGVGPIPDQDKDHMYHLIVSLPPGNEWTDEQWSKVGWDLVKGLGFTEGPDDAQGCKVVGMRHGTSVGGNDHMHIAVNLVREDGRRAYVPQYDFAQVQQIRRDIENRYDFVLPLQDRGREPNNQLPAYTQVEAQRAHERSLFSGRPELPDRVVLQQMVRAAATASATEAEFIYQLMAATPELGLEAASWSPGKTEAVGYRVWIEGHEERLTASQLAPDLTLPKLRQQWAENEDDVSRAEARALWQGETPPTVPEEPTVRQALHQVADELERWHGQVVQLAPEQVAEWNQVSRDEAGLVAILARTQGPLGQEMTPLAQHLSRQALPDRSSANLPPVSYGRSTAQSAARNLQVITRASHPNSQHGWAAVLQQMRQVAQAITAAQMARGELARARQTHAAAVGLNTYELQYRKVTTGALSQTQGMGQAAPAKAIQAQQVRDRSMDGRGM